MSEEVGINLLKALILYPYLLNGVLQVDESSRCELSAPMEHHHVIAKRQSHLRNCGIFQQSYHRRRKTDDIEAEEETHFSATNLQQGHFVHCPFLERRACLGVDTKNIARKEIVNGTRRLSFIQYNDDTPTE